MHDTIPRDLTQLFGSSVKVRGRALEAAGEIRITSCLNGVASGRVAGTSEYDWTIQRAANGWVCHCTCPYAQSVGHCKHLWGAVLSLSHHGALRDLADGLGSLPASVPAAPVRATRVSTPPPPPAPPAWTAPLKRIRASADASPYAKVDGGETGAGREAIYLLAFLSPDGMNRRGVFVDLLLRRRKKNGEWSVPRPSTLPANQIHTLPDPVDRELVTRLTGAASSAALAPFGAAFAPSHFQLSPALSAQLIPPLVETGRFFLRVPEQFDRPLRFAPGPELRFDLQAAYDESGALRLRPALLDPDTGVGVRIENPVYFPGFVASESRHLLHRLAPGHPDVFWMAACLQMGELVVPAAEVAAFLREWHNHAAAPLLAPPSAGGLVVRRETPVPVARVKRHTRFPDTLILALSFRYGGTEIEGWKAGVVHTVPSEGEEILLLRDPGAEAAARARLLEGGAREWDYHERREYPGEGRAHFHISHRVFAKLTPLLLGEEWMVEAEGALYRSASGFDLAVASGVDWFDLSGTATFDDQEVRLPELLAALRKGEKWIKLGDGSLGLLPEDWLRRVAGVAGMGEATDDGRMRFRRAQAFLLDALLQEQPAVRVDEVFTRVRDQLRSFTTIEAADPVPTFLGSLRPYQREGLGWLRFLNHFGLGGCLADDMGLGKTVQVLALLAERAHARRAHPPGHPDRPPPSLVVAPRSLMFNWTAEAARFCPELRVADHSGPTRRKDAGAFDDADVILTTYGILRTDIGWMNKVELDYAILDESQAIKNDKTLSAKAARLLRARHRLAMSGTPVENHLGELWSLFEFLNPGMLGTSSAFQELQAGPGGAGRDHSVLARALRPFILRRTKRQVATDLPDRTEKTLYCELEGAQLTQYTELRDFYRAKLLGKGVTDEKLRGMSMNVLEALLRLRQAACHPGLLDTGKNAPASSAKFDLLVAQLQELAEEGHKALVFSQFTSLLELLKPLLKKAGLAYEYLDGQTTDRQACVHRFQTDPDCGIFLLSLKAGGVGLNLTAAEYVFLLDPWWNPAVEAQAIDRAHRIGQTRPVMAYRVIAKGTIEERVLELQQSKRDLAEAIITADNSLIRNLKREDLERLLG